MRRLAAAALLLAAALPAGALSSPPLPAADPAGELLEGVASVDAPGVPGPLVLAGGGAVPLVTGGPDGEPVAAASRLGPGRVVALGHNGYVAPESRNRGDTARFLDNALRWAAGGRKAPLVGVLGESLRGPLERSGFRVAVLDGLRPRDIGEAQVLLLDVHRVDDEARPAVRAHLLRGGGLVAGGLGWGWLQLNPGKGIGDHPGSLLLGEAGILWADGTLERTAPGGFATGRGRLGAAHAERALEVLLAAENGQGRTEAPLVRQASAVLVRAARTLPPGDPRLLPALRRLAAAAGRAPPTAERPLGPGDPLSRALLAFEAVEAARLPPAEVRAHPAAASFPGLPLPGARTVRRTVALDLSRPRWQGTGLYAAPGASITASLPRSADGAGLFLRIGCHTDELWHLGEWRRVPGIAMRVPLRGGETRAASPFGGLLYLEGPGALHGTAVDVILEGAVEAPRFVLGETTLKEWNDRIRDRPAPWAELESSRIVLTVPAAEARKVADPEALLRFWDRVLDGCADLAGLPSERASPERFVADVQISAGYMHAGYPIMVHLDAPPFLLDLEGMEKGRHAWGPFHELGHNHQSPDWTFEGTGEVTNNLFTLYLLETICGAKPGEGHGAYPAKAAAIREYLDSGPDFARWKRDPFLALTMYGQVREAFGWEPFLRVFAEYADLPGRERPATDDAKRDQWLVRLSRAAGRNLGPFFAAWGVPVSEAARREVEALPGWMPEGFPPR